MKASFALRFVGFDTETCKGRVLVLCSPTDSIEYPTTAQALRFIYDRIPYATGAGTFYNLRFDVSVILRDAAAEDPEGVRSGDFTHGGFRVHSVPGKALVIAPVGGGPKSKRYVYDVAQFYPGTLDKAAQAVLGDRKTAEAEGIDRELMGNEPGYYEARREAAIRYCRHDADLAGRLMERFSADVRSAVGVYPRAWYSGASVAKAILASRLPENPFYDWPEECITDSCAAFGGGIFNCWGLGRYPSLTEVDINAAYPHAITTLPDVWNEDPTRTDRPHPEATGGIYRVRILYDGTVPYRMPDRKSIIYPVSTEPIEAWLTVPELSQFPHAEILRGWELFGRPNAKLTDTVRSLYALRCDYKAAKDPRDAAVKVAMNSLFGAWAETRAGWTRHTNLLLAAIVTGHTRAYIRGLIRTHGNVVYSATDSVGFSRPPGIVGNETLGGLKVYPPSDVIVYANGIRIVNGRLEKKRGLRRFDASDLLGAAGSKISKVTQGPLPLLRGIVEKRYSEIGAWVDMDKTIDLEANLIRGVPDGPLTFENLRSNPVSMLPHHVSAPPTFKVLTPPQLAALRNGEYPGAFREDDLEGENEE